ncbi:MAG: TolC family protein [Parachlamydiaceae bacterium]
MLFKRFYLHSLLIFLTSVTSIYSQDDSPHSKEEKKCLVLTLETAVSQALNANRQLLETVDHLTQAQYGVNLAKNEFSLSISPNSEAGYVGHDRGKPGWRLGGGIDFSKKLTTGTSVSVAPSVIKMRDHYQTKIETTIVQPLLRGLGKDYQLSYLKGAQFSLRTAYRNVYIAQTQLVLRTIQTLYEVVKLEHTAILNQESYERITQFYKASKLKEKIGLADAFDVYRAQIELRQSEDALKGTQERLEETKDALRDLLALPLDLCIKVDIPTLYAPHPIDVDQAIEIALNTRIEMDQARDDQNENKRLSSLAKKNLYPELNLVLNYSNVGRAKDFSTSCKNARENTWGIGLTSSNEMNPLADQIAYAQSLIAISSGSRDIEQTEATLILEIKRAVRQLQRAFERIDLQEAQIKTAQGELHLAKIKFDRGMTDNFNLIQSEKSLRNAQQHYWSAMIDHMVGQFQLMGAMGLLIDKPRMNIP